MVQALCMPRLVKYPLTNSEVKLADFKNRVDAGDQERFEALMWEETEGLVDLGTTTSTSAPGEYTEKLSMKALLQLLPHAERGLQELGLDRMVTDGRNKGMTKRDAMVRDITALIEYGRQNHVEDDGVIEVSVTYHYKYTQ